MVAAMSPALCDDDYVFCTSATPVALARASDVALATFREDEGTTLVLTAEDASALGFDAGLPMKRIVLTVHSALDGIGLTAAVSTALAAAGIACNVIAAYHHDHIFVPSADGQRALAILVALQGEAAAG